MGNHESEHTHEDHSKEKNEHFQGQQPIMEQIYKLGFADYAKTLPSLKEAFNQNDRAIRCIDEGTPGGLHSAGSGILREKEEVLEVFRAAGVTKVFSHEGCGAAGLYAKEHNLEGNPDEYGKKWASEIAGELGVPYEHINSALMKPYRPPEFHVARVAYYDGTGEFDYSRVKGLPPGFIASREMEKYPISPKNGIGISINIALGPHGLGELITPENPFVIVVIGNSEEELQSLKSELQDIETKHSHRVIIDGFVKPKEE